MTWSHHRVITRPDRNRMESFVLDVVYIAGILALVALVALIGRVVEKL